LAFVLGDQFLSVEFNELPDNPTVRRIFGLRCTLQQKPSAGTQGNQFSRPVAGLDGLF
jgi:hypothetical protein